MLKSLQFLSALRDSQGFAFTCELDHAIGAAVRFMGPKIVLQAVPLQITGDEWVL